MIKYEVIVYDNSYREWCINGKLHREDGPAVESNGGYRAWYINGKRHREDGPAVERADGSREWWLDGEEVLEEEFNRITQKTVEMTLEEVCEALGKNIKIVKG